MEIDLWIPVLLLMLNGIYTQGTSVSLLQQTYFLFPGENVTVSVNVTFDPNDEYAITWIRNSNNISTKIRSFEFPEKYSGGDRRNPSLTILNVNETDTGNYSISVLGGRSSNTAGPARVYVLTKSAMTRYEESANNCPVDWETVYEIDTKKRPIIAVKGCVLNMTSWRGSFYKAQQTCRIYKSALLPLSPKLYQDSIIEGPSFAYPKYSFWTGTYDRYGSLVTDGTPPLHLDSFVSNYFGRIYVSGNWTEDSPLCIGSQNALQELHIRNCNDILPFLCYKRADDFTFTRDLNICPSGWIGGVDMESCYLLRNVSSRALSRSDAVQFCRQKGGELLQLKLVSDWRLAVRILGYYRLINTYVWYNELSGIANCPSLHLNDRMTMTSRNNCSLTSQVICQTGRKTTEYSSNDVQIIFQPPTTTPNPNPNASALYNGGEITCIFPTPHLETDTYRLYKGGNLHIQLKDFQTNYSTPIMSWNNDDNSDILILSSAASDIEIYTCEVQRKGFGYLASQEVYAIPNGKRVFVLHGSVRLTGIMELSDALLSTYWGGSGSNWFSLIYSQIRDLFNFVSYTLFRNSALRFIRIQHVSLKYGNTVDFLVDYVAPSEEWKPAREMKELLSNITETAKLGFPQRRKRQAGPDGIDYKTVEIRSEEICTIGYSPDFQSSFTFQAVGNGSTTYSENICITDFEPLLTGVCYTSTASPAEIRHVSVNPNCRFLLDSIFTMTSLKNLSEISLDTSNIESIAADVANHTSNSSELDVPDVVYIAVILQNIAKIPSISVQTLDDVLQTFTNVLEAPESILKTAHDIGSSTTRIIESVETITRNTAFNGPLYQNFQTGYAVAAVAPDAPSVVGIQVKKKDGNADLSNETVNLITAEEYSNLSTVNAGIVLPEVSVQGNKTKAFFTVYENTKLFQVRSNNKRYELNGNVWSATLVTEGKVVTDLGGKFVTSVYKPINDTVESVCGFWNHSLYDTSGGWSTNGCQKTEVMDDGRVVCQCDHLTNFAILLDIKGQDDIIDPANTLALSVITIIGLSLSIIGLGFTVLSFILFKPLRQGRGQQTLLNLALALLCSMIIFLAGMERTESYYGCIAVAALMHYFLLVSFMWMLVEGFLQYLRFVRVLGTYIPRFMLKASIPAWGLPLLPVIIVLAVDYDLYKGGTY
ncbi:uncharacterized protein LOC125679062 isoform X2 [Ostrea edulis]|nr:uncharacterized protein LOC125679062 isoform X2 [Ostrea edulis]